FNGSDLSLADAVVAPLGAERVALLKSQGWIRMDDESHVVPYSDGGFATPSGKVEFFSSIRADEGLDPLPAYRPAREGVHGDATLVERYPLVALTAKGAHHFLNSSYGHVDRARRAEREPAVQINPVDADARTIVDGSQVRVFNDRGSLVLKAEVGESVRPGVVSVPSGWWASASPGGRSANALTSDGISDLGGGGDFHDTLVDVEPASSPL
ncbi:MAG: molybdopterin dinucleotide binding domain-containing protein, partial [Actinomycetes bacterium]